MPQASGKIPSPGGRVARVSGAGEECGRKPESPYHLTDLLQGRSSCPGVGLWIFCHPALPPAFLFSHQSVPKSRLATASPREKRFGAARRNAGDGVPYGVGGAVSLCAGAGPASRVHPTERSMSVPYIGPRWGEKGPAPVPLRHCEGAAATVAIRVFPAPVGPGGALRCRGYGLPRPVGARNDSSNRWLGLLFEIEV